LDCGYRIDLVVEQQMIVEVKSVDQLLRIHEAQLLTYLRLSGLQIGLLLNFNAVLLKHGIRRYALSSSARSAVDLS
jgi:GxxExxY protein